MSYPYFVQMMRLLLIVLLVLASQDSRLRAEAMRDSSVIDLHDLTNEPFFLYDYLSIHPIVDTAQPPWSQSLSDLQFTENDTREHYERSSSYYVKLEIRNDSAEPHSRLLNFSPNNWNQSWNHIAVQAYRADTLVIDVSTGYDYEPGAKPVRSVMNLLRLELLPHDELTIYCYLEGGSDQQSNTAGFIDFALLQEDQAVGLIAGYPFHGDYINCESHSTFKANHLVNHAIYLETETYKSIQEIDTIWDRLETHDLFNSTPQAVGVYWLKTTLIGTPQFNGTQVFQISDAPYWADVNYYPANDIFSYDYIDGYYRDIDGDFVHQRVGDHVDIEDRPLCFWANLLTVDIPIGDTVDYYIRLEGADRRFPISAQVIYHIDPLSMFPSQVNQGWEHGLYYGALGIYLVFFSFLFIVERERLYLYFAIAILGLLMMNIFAEDIFSRYVVFPTWRDYHVPLYFIGAFAQAFGFLKFTERFFLIEKSTLVSRYIVPGFITTIGAVALYCALFFKYIQSIGNPVFEPYMLAFLFMQLVSIVLPIVIAVTAENKQEVSKFSYFISFSPVVIAGVFHFGSIFLLNLVEIEGFHSREESEQSFNFIKMGVAAMLTLFAMNVGFRANRLKAAKKQAIMLAEKNVIIEAKSKQNETLLKEIHHRVKNNLQTISSLLYLQSYGEKNQKTKDNIAITQQRVESMALIHKNLYQRDNLAAIEMKEYIKNLCYSLISAYQTPDKQVALVLDMEPFELDIDRAIPLGLVINEIVTNAMKYAFPKVYQGRLTVSMQISDHDAYTLLIADNGIGKSDDAVPSFGSQLIKLLTKQIRAKMTSGNDDGHWVSITWADDEPSYQS